MHFPQAIIGVPQVPCVVRIPEVTQISVREFYINDIANFRYVHFELASGAPDTVASVLVSPLVSITGLA